MGAYRKLIAAIIGVGAMVATDLFGIPVDAVATGAEHTVSIVDALLGLGTIVGVWAVPNRPLAREISK